MFDVVLYSSLGLCTGALMAYLTNKLNHLVVSAMMSVSAGVMIGVVSFDFLTEAWELGGFSWTAAGLCMGFLFGLLFDKTFHRHAIHWKAEGANELLQSGVLIGAGLALHNFPTGFTIGSAFAHVPHLGRELSMVMFLHNVPEGLAMSIPLVMGRIRPVHLFLLVLAISAPFMIGITIGAMLEMENAGVLAALIGIASGVILYVSWFDIFLNSLRGHWILFAFILFVLGYYVSAVFL